jgi:hypothetical protein
MIYDPRLIPIKNGHLFCGPYKRNAGEGKDTTMRFLQFFVYECHY